MSEEFDVSTRGAFFDSVGTIRDVVENHLFQIVAILAMEAPGSHTYDAFRNEKAKVIEAMRKLHPRDVVRGQYRGYRTTKGVAKGSKTETYAAVRVHVDTWRWGGVPFLIRAGKSLPVTATEVFAVLKHPPQNLFGETGPPVVNYVRFRLGPGEAIAFGTRVKKPGAQLAGEEVELVASQAEAAGLPPYERLLGDALRGDQELFARQDLVEAAWRVVDDVLAADTPVLQYKRGTWGPKEANELVPRTHTWHDPEAEEAA
jgi:glucose-6-phosphate 1-dehydrogenase